jgi:hypothetical protein
MMLVKIITPLNKKQFNTGTSCKTVIPVIHEIKARKEGYPNGKSTSGPIKISKRKMIADIRGSTFIIH